MVGALMALGTSWAGFDGSYPTAPVTRSFPAGVMVWTAINLAQWVRVAAYRRIVSQSTKGGSA